MHTLFCGVTQTGKTTLARSIARGLRRKKQAVVVFDPVGTVTAGGDWGAGTLVLDDEAKFWSVVTSSDTPKLHVFVDEADMLFSMRRPENHWALTRGRHYGLIVYLITQRPKMVAPSVRAQCARCYMFRMASEDADEVGRDFGHSKLSREKLDRGEFLILDSGYATYKRGALPFSRSPT